MVNLSSSVVTNVFKNTMLNRTFKETPDYSFIQKGSIGIGTTNAAVDDTDLESVISGWANGDDKKIYEDGFPALFEPDKTASTRTFVTSLQANGNSITEYADFNGDGGTPRIGGRFTFTGITKNKNIQVFFKPIYRMV